MYILVADPHCPWVHYTAISTHKIQSYLANSVKFDILVTNI